MSRTVRVPDFGDSGQRYQEVDFGSAWFGGGEVGFLGARFSGGTVDFQNPSNWSFLPAFPWTGTPPAGVKLPKSAGQSPPKE